MAQQLLRTQQGQNSAAAVKLLGCIANAWPATMTDALALDAHSLHARLLLIAPISQREGAAC